MGNLRENRTPIQWHTAHKGHNWGCNLYSLVPIMVLYGLRFSCLQSNFRKTNKTPKTLFSLNGHPIECSQNNRLHIEQKPLFDSKDKRAIDSQEKKQKMKILLSPSMQKWNLYRSLRKEPVSQNSGRGLEKPWLSPHPYLQTSLHLQTQPSLLLFRPNVVRTNGMKYAQQGRKILDRTTDVDSLGDGRQGLN